MAKVIKAIVNALEDPTISIDSVEEMFHTAIMSELTNKSKNLKIGSVK